jgi:uncharacterized RDD family membrane protein YckC
MDITPDYSKYTLHELIDVKKHIDREAHPERFIELEKCIAIIADSEKEGIIEYDEAERYSTFWPRFFASIIDGIIFAVVLFLESKLIGFDYDSGDKFWQNLNYLQVAIYATLMHGFFGQTVGKMICNVKVLNFSDESEIGLKQAFRRESVNLFISAMLVMFGIIIPYLIDAEGNMSNSTAIIMVTFVFASLAWWIAEFITMLFNEKRRAVHDFIGKTVVVRT